MSTRKIFPENLNGLAVSVLIALGKVWFKISKMTNTQFKRDGEDLRRFNFHLPCNIFETYASRNLSQSLYRR